jgi:hypothetical protein
VLKTNPKKELLVTLREYYHLRKNAFSIDPRDDAEAYFGGATLVRQIKDRVKSDFVQQRQVPKFCVFGAYGSGKTHTLHYIEYVMKTEFHIDFPTEVIELEISPLRAKESWRKVHRDLINAISLERMKKAVATIFADPATAQDPLGTLQAKGILRFGEAAIQSSQAQVFRALIYGGRGEALALEWLKGTALTMDQAQTISTETNLTEPSHLIAGLLNVASLLWHGLGKRPVVLIDEAESLGSLTNADAIQEFTFAFRRLFDNENNVLGIIVAFEGEGGIEEAPRVLADEAVMRRIDYQAGYFDLGRLVVEMNDAREFILAVLKYLVDADAAQKTIEEEGLDTQPEYFPFTENAVDVIANYVTQEPALQLPSQIISKLGAAVVKGWMRADGSGHVLIDDEIVNEVLYPEDM